jgi:hypothetical protein
MTFSSTDRPRINWNCWNTKPKVARRSSVRKRSGRAEMSRPSRRTRPLLGRVRPPIKPSSVVLPEPLGPRSAVIRPGSMPKLTSRTAVNSFGWPALKVLLT